MKNSNELDAQIELARKNLRDLEEQKKQIFKLPWEYFLLENGFEPEDKIANKHAFSKQLRAGFVWFQFSSGIYFWGARGSDGEAVIQTRSFNDFQYAWEDFKAEENSLIVRKVRVSYEKDVLTHRVFNVDDFLENLDLHKLEITHVPADQI